MKILVVHDQFGEIRSVAIPGRPLPPGELQWRLQASEFVALVDVPSLPEGKELPGALEKMRGEFHVATGPARLVRKKQASKEKTNRKRSTPSIES
jgi:hypothetical protein